MQFNKEIHIASTIISRDRPVFFIAEAGVNHNGSIERAVQLIDEAKSAGADAVKFQSFCTEHLILSNVKKADYQTQTTGANESQFDMLKKLELSIDDTKKLKNYCAKKQILFLTTPFDEHSLDLLDELDLPAYKISSTDTTNLPFIVEVAKKGKPVILSTGMTYLDEIDIALRYINEINKDVILLQCSSNYPLQDTEVNLNVLDEFHHKYDMLIGYSDHTESIGAAPYAVAKGAKVIEKHFTLDKNLPGPDHRASLDIKELKECINEIRKVERYLGSATKQPTQKEVETRIKLQKSLVAKCDIKTGELFSRDNIIAKRTGGIGISPIKCFDVFGKKSSKDFKKDTIIEIDL